MHRLGPNLVLKKSWSRDASFRLALMSELMSSQKAGICSRSLFYLSLYFICDVMKIYFPKAMRRLVQKIVSF